MKKMLFLLSFLFLYATMVSNAQDVKFYVPTFKKSFLGRELSGYYHTALNKIVINEKLKNGVGHFLYDTSFNLISKYKKTYKDDDDNYSKLHLRFARHINIEDGFWEAYVCNSAVAFKHLDFDNSNDSTMAILNFKDDNINAQLIALMPQKHGCDILTFCHKKKENKLILYRWVTASSNFEKTEFDLPASTLSEAEIAKYTKYAALDYDDCFKRLTVSRTDQPDVFQMPSENQLFYSDTALYIINPTPYSTGFHEVALNFVTKQLRTNNIMLNKLDQNIMGTSDQKHPSATVYNGTLIIENSSDKIFEYQFLDLYNGAAIRSYSVDVKDSLDNLIHSPYNQLGTFGSAGEEKDIRNPKTFIKRKNKGWQFIKAMKVEDSLIITSGSFVKTNGLDGLMLTAFSSLGGYSLGIVIDNMQYIPYLVSMRNKFLYAHSKFDTKTWTPSNAHNVTTIMDKLIDTKKLEQATNDNSLFFFLQNKFYVAIYTNDFNRYDVLKY